MKIYSDRAPTAVRQVVTDVLVLVWVYAWVRAGVWVHDLVMELAVPGQKLDSAGTGIADNLAEVSGKIDGVPIVGGELAGMFNDAAGAARSLAGAGQQQQEVVADLATAITVALLVFPLGLVLLVWLPLRVRYALRAGAAVALRGSPAGRDLLALRALTNRPLRQLVRIDPDVARSWRSGEESTVDALAALELRALGLLPAGQAERSASRSGG